MARGYRIAGLDRLQKDLRKLKEEVAAQAKALIEDAADQIVIEAGQDVPVDLGVLRQSIGNEPKNGGWNYIAYVNAEYAPFVEFGTGTKVDVPTELNNYAAQFRGVGEKSVNLPARPFFFPAYFKARAKLIKDLNTIIKNNV